MIDLNNHWEGVDIGNRHIIKGMNKTFKDRHLNNFKKYYLDYIDITEITSSLDWGCGGGLLSKELKNFSKNVYVVDVSTHSLKMCDEYASPSETFLLKNSPLDIELPNVDLVLANAIVWHFPTLDYFKEVINKWVELNPKYIIFNTKRKDQTIETKNYSKDFLNALYLKDSDVIELLKDKGYTLVVSNVPQNTKQPSTYFVFKK